MSERVTLSTSDGESLEARWDVPQQPSGVVVLCHPHPLQAGSMMAPLMIALTTGFNERGLSVLRFNFRGTGQSTGSHDYGKAELLDVASAVEAAMETRLDLHISGWSFGAGVALNWLAGQQGPVPISVVAPPPDALPEKLPPGPKRIVVGNRDQVIDVEALRRYAEQQSIDLLLTPGDHFFHGRGKKVAALVAQGFE